MSEDDYVNLEKSVRETLEALEGDGLKGTYHPLTETSPEQQQIWIEEHYLFKEGDRFLVRFFMVFLYYANLMLLIPRPGFRQRHPSLAQRPRDLLQRGQELCRLVRGGGPHEDNLHAKGN